MAGFIPAIHVSPALEQVVDARVKPGHDESWKRTAMIGKMEPVRPYSAGLASGGGGLAEGGAPAAVLAVAARFSTMATATIEPS